MDKTILVFGTSLEWGAWDREGGWVQRLKNILDQRNMKEEDYWCALYNLGVSGHSTREILERLEPEAKSRTHESRDSAIIFSVGVNDSYYFTKEKRFNVTADEYRENLGKLLSIARKFTKEIVFLGLTPVDERVDPVPWRTEISYRLEYVEKYNDILKQFCKENKIHFIDILGEFMKKDCKGLLEDGAHPNSEGHELIFTTVRDFLKEKHLL